MLVEALEKFLAVLSPFWNEPRDADGLTRTARAAPPGYGATGVGFGSGRPFAAMTSRRRSG